MPAGSAPGERRGGRQKGTPNRATAARVAAIAASGMTPLDYLVSVYRDETASRAERLEAASKAAPHVHPRLAAVELTAAVEVEPQIDFSGLNAEERALMRRLLESLRARLGAGAVGDLAQLHALPAADEDLEDAA
jgi:hypothetical protein